MLTIALFGCVECLLGRSAAQRHSCVLACHLTDVRTQAPSPCLSPAWTPSHNTGWTPSPHTRWTPSPHTGWTPSPPPSHRSAMPTPTFQAITAKMTPDYRLLYSPSAPVSAAITSTKMSPDYSLLYSPTAPICAAVTSSKMSPDYTMSPPGFPYPRYDNTTRGNISHLPQGCPCCGPVCQVGHQGFGDGDYYDYTKVDRMLMFQPPPDVSW